MIRQTFPLHGIPRKFEILMPRKFLALTVFETYKVKRCQFVSGKNVLSTELAGQFVVHEVYIMARFLGIKSLSKSHRNKTNRMRKSIKFYNRSKISIEFFYRNV